MASWHHKWKLTIVHQTQWSVDLPVEPTLKPGHLFDNIKMSVLNFFPKSLLLSVLQNYLCVVMRCEGCLSLSLIVPESCSTCYNYPSPTSEELSAVMQADIDISDTQGVQLSIFYTELQAGKREGRRLFPVSGFFMLAVWGVVRAALLIVCWLWRRDVLFNFLWRTWLSSNSIWPTTKQWHDNSDLSHLTGLGRDHNTRCRLMWPDTSQVYQQSLLYLTFSVRN